MWDSNQYWLKARLYVSRLSDDAREGAERALWAALALELLGRAALSKIHPSLNADPTNETNLFYALGFEIKGQPRSLPVHAVFSRLERLVPEFDKPTKEFCDFFMIVRNRELHTSEQAFEGLAEGEWLPRYYAACRVLCQFLEHTLEQLFGEEAADSAQKLIEALESDKRADVERSIAAHRRVFEEKGEDERSRLRQEQAVLSQVWRGASSGVECPACGSLAELTGELERESEPMYRDGSLLVDETYLATGLECAACGLVLRDIQEIHHAGLDPHFTHTIETDLHAYFEPEYYEEYNNM